jgi:drug/metabolite transporter (DMT)-like permease
VLSRAKPTPYDFALYATVLLAWGFAWIGIHLQVGIVSPDISVLWRFLLAGLVTLAIAFARGDRLRYSARDHAMFALLGLVLFSFNFVLFYEAAEVLPSGLLSIVFSLVSFINVWLGALFLGAPIDRRVVVGGLLGAVGMAAMFYPQFAGHGFPTGALMGLAFSLLGTIMFCFGNIISATFNRRRIPVFAATGYAMLYGSAILAVYALARGHAFILDWSVSYLAALVYLAIVASVVAFACYLTLVGRIGADRAGYVTVLGPIVALAVSTVFENLQWSAMAGLGLVAVLAGNVLVLRPTKK